jgi:hypothetical protein
MFWCDKCRIWEHEKCLTDSIRKDYIKSKLGSASKKGRKSSGKSIYITISADDTTGEVTAYIDDKERKVKPETAAENETAANVSDERVNVEPDEDGVKTSIPVKCLKCGAQLK